MNKVQENLLKGILDEHYNTGLLVTWTELKQAVEMYKQGELTDDSDVCVGLQINTIIQSCVLSDDEIKDVILEAAYTIINK